MAGETFGLLIFTSNDVINCFNLQTQKEDATVFTGSESSDESACHDFDWFNGFLGKVGVCCGRAGGVF